MKKRHLLHALFILFSHTTFGQLWSPKAAGLLPANFSVADISIVNGQVIWATAIDWGVSQPIPAAFVSKLLKSTDGGETWTVKDIEETMGRVCWDIHAFDENTACITTTNRGSGNKRGIYRTTDGGETWNEVFNHNAGGSWIHFFDSQEGICGKDAAIARTINGGMTWTLVPNVPGLLSGEITGFAALSNGIGTFGNSVWFGTSKERMFKTENRGLDWTVYHTGLGANTFLGSCGFMDEKNGLGLFDHASGGITELARTTDGGLTWQKTGNLDLYEVDAIPCSNTFIGISYSPAQGTSLSSDFGVTWTKADTTIEGTGPVFLTPEIGWMGTFSAVGSGPALYKWVGGSLDTRIYVNKNATGANTGTSWVDAYTDLQAALAAAKAGDEIRVAEGVYTSAAPGGNQTATFLIDKNLKLYGGFAGTECYLSERDMALHPTVLSGDLNGDDVADDFSQYRSDNVQHVVRVSASVTEAAEFDGFTVRGGQADGTTLSEREGGGMTCSGKLRIRNCVFAQNFAQQSGGGIRISNIANPGILLENCQIAHNQANVAGGISINSTDTFLVRGCTFSGNVAQSGILQAAGGGLHIGRSSGLVDHCTFLGNKSLLYGGGLLVIDYLGSPGNSTVEVSDCYFEGNSSANNDGGLSINSWVNNNTYTARRCTFVNNTAVNNGAGLSCYVQSGSGNTSILVDSCTFFKNSAGGNGGGISTIFEGKNMSLVFKNCHFSENTAVWECGAADFWSTEGATGLLTVDSCLFERDSAFWAGALEMGNGWGNVATQVNYQLTNSTFRNNHAADQAGAALLWSDEKAKTIFLVENCLIENNSSAGKGGGIIFAPTSTDYHAIVNRTQIVGNQSAGSGGAVMIDFEVFENVPLPTNASLLFENCVLAGNSSAGAAIAGDSLPNLAFLNSTVANNAGGGIQLSNYSGLTLQNTILHNTGFAEYTATTNDVTVSSLGGNLIGDGSLASAALSYDLQNADPLFAAPGDYHLADNSPAIDKGVDLGNLPATDLDGNDRRYMNGCVDIGAYESTTVVSTACVTGSYEAAAAGWLIVSPNPVADLLNIQLPETQSASFEVQAFDVQGRPVLHRVLFDGQPLEVQGLTPGMYALKVMMGDRVFAGRFFKQ